jgi:hypothetical protein
MNAATTTKSNAPFYRSSKLCSNYVNFSLLVCSVLHCCYLVDWCVIIKPTRIIVPTEEGGDAIQCRDEGSEQNEEYDTTAEVL